MNGPELADRLRATRPEIKVLFMSAFTSELVAAYGVFPGDPLISKPFTVMAWLRKSAECSATDRPFRVQERRSVERKNYYGRRRARALRGIMREA